MRSRVALVALLIALLASASFANTLDVNAGAAITGSFGLEVQMSDTGQAFVLSDHPNNEEVFSAEFNIRQNTVSINQTGRITVLLGQDLDAVQKAGIRVMLINTVNFGYIIRYRMRRDDGNFTHCGDQGFPLNPAVSRKFRVEWTNGGAPSSGTCALYSNGSLKYSASGVDVDTRNVDRVLFGAIEFANVGSPSGSYHLDDYASFRTVTP